MSDRLTTGQGPWLASTEIETDKAAKGSNLVEVWEGSEAECRNYIYIVQGNGATVTKLSAKGDGNWSLRASYPYDKDGNNQGYVDTMELEVNVINQRWENSPIFRSKFSDYVAVTRSSARADACITIIRDIAQKYRSGLPTLVQVGSDMKAKWMGTYYATKELALDAEWLYRIALVSGLTSGDKAAAYKMLLLVIRGLSGFLEYSHVFRRRVTAGNSNSIRANTTGAGKIWTSAEVVSWEGIPQNGWFDLPVSVQWHKDKPRVTASYGSRTEISYSYTEVATASDLLYEAYGSAVLL
jgi:hypothetical protein